MGESSAEFNSAQQATREQSYLKRLAKLEGLRFLYNKPTVEGRENLPSGSCVIATTHLSIFDVPEVAAEMMHSRKTGVVLQSHLLSIPFFRPLVHLMGKERFFPLSNRDASVLPAGEIEQMKDAITRDRRTLVVAAYNPNDKANSKLSDKPGLAAIILAHRARVPLVPVVLNIESKTPLIIGFRIRRFDVGLKNLMLGKKPNAKMIIGNPISYPEIPEDKLEAAINLYSLDKRRVMTDQQIVEAKETLAVLQAEAGEVMKALASNLPPEKRGKWG